MTSARPRTSLRQKLAGFIGEIFENRSRLENAQRPLAVARFEIDDRRNPIVRRNFQKLRRELLALADVYRLERVRQARLL